MTGYDPVTVTAHLAGMHRHRVATSGDPGRRARLDVPRRWRWRPERLEAAARARGVHGYYAERARTRAAESETWAWWCAELAWLRAPRRERLPHPGQPELVPLPGARRRGRYPRRRVGGRVVPDHASALSIVRDTYTERAATA